MKENRVTLKSMFQLLCLWSTGVLISR